MGKWEMGNGKKWNAHDTSGKYMLCKVAQVFARGGRPILLFAFIPFSGIKESSCILTKYMYTFQFFDPCSRATASADYSCRIVSLSYKAIVVYITSCACKFTHSNYINV